MMIGKRKLAKVAFITCGVVTTASAAVSFEHFSLRRQASETELLSAPQSFQIPNFNFVHSYFLRGASPTPYGMEWLKNNGVKTIVDLRQSGSASVDGERETALAMGFRYVNLPVKTFPSVDQVKHFLALVEGAKENGEAVFVHCNYGSDRTGFFVFLWRVFGDRWRVSLALTEMIEHGFFVHKFQENKCSPLADPSNW